MAEPKLLGQTPPHAARLETSQGPVSSIADRRYLMRVFSRNSSDELARLKEEGKAPPVTAGDALRFAQIMASNSRKRAGKAERKLKVIKANARSEEEERFVSDVMEQVEGAAEKIRQEKKETPRRIEELEKNLATAKGIMDNFRLKLKSPDWRWISARLFSLTFSGGSLLLLHSATARLGVFAYPVDFAIVAIAYGLGEAVVRLLTLGGEIATDILGEWMRGAIKREPHVRILGGLAEDVLEKIEEFYPEYADALARKYPLRGLKGHARKLAKRIKKTEGMKLA